MNWFSRLPNLLDALLHTMRGGVATADYGALASWLSLPAHRDAYPLAQMAIVGRQGCSRSDGPRLRDELLAARQVLANVGVHVSRRNWEGFADRLERTPLVLESVDDILRLAALGQLERGHARLVELLPQTRDRALSCVLEWMASGTLNDVAVHELAETVDPDETWTRNFETSGPWLVFSRPNEHARALLTAAHAHWKKNLRAVKSDGDGDFAETVHRHGAAVELLTVVVAAWDGVVAPAELSKAFCTYYEKTVDYYGLVGPVSATCLEMNLSAKPLAPREALGRLRGFIREPMTPRPNPVAHAAPATRALDAIVARLAVGNGLSVRSGRERIELVAEPQEISRDFI